MPTSKADRLNKLFEGDSLPPPPDPNTPHIADTEIVPKMQHAQQPWAVPKVAQQPRRVARSPPRTGRDIEQLTSSDDDEYVRAFRKTPSIKSEIASKSRKNSSKDSSRSPAQHPGQRPTEKARSDGTDADQEVDDGVSQMDRDGNPLIGRFCPLMLVTKFCYKYMDDPNDRVSKHFFASGKIWNRTWDM